MVSESAGSTSGGRDTGSQILSSPNVRRLVNTRPMRHDSPSAGSERPAGTGRADRSWTGRAGLGRTASVRVALEEVLVRAVAHLLGTWRVAGARRVGPRIGLADLPGRGLVADGLLHHHRGQPAGQALVGMVVPERVPDL